MTFSACFAGMVLYYVWRKEVDMAHDELAERIEALEGILAVEQGKALIHEARALIFPRPKQTRVPRRANGEPWGGDGIGPYTEEYKAWAEADKRFRAYMGAGAFLDAAMTLVPKGYVLGAIKQRTRYEIAEAIKASVDPHEQAAWMAWVHINTNDRTFRIGRRLSHHGHAATPALALCAAALRARNT